MNSTIKNNLNFIQSKILTKHDIDTFSIQTFQKGDTIIRQGDSINDLYFVLEGSSKVNMSFENGKNILMSFINGFYLLGDIEYITNANATCDVSALNEVTYFKVSYDVLDLSYKKDSDFQHFLLKYISRKLLNSSKRSQFNNVYPLIARLSSYLYSFSNKGEDLKVTLPNLKDVSDNLCTSYRHMQRVFKTLEDKNIITRENHQVIITNIEELKKLSRGNIYEEQFNEKEY